MRPQRNIVLEGHRQVTREWWDHHRHRFDLFISGIVLTEISRGDPVAAAERLAIAQGLPLLEELPGATTLGMEIVKQHALPPNALQDALHLATASHHNIDILTTWNCRHIANPHILRSVRQFVLQAGLRMPEVTTPDALLGGSDEFVDE